MTARRRPSRPAARGPSASMAGRHAHARSSSGSPDLGRLARRRRRKGKTAKIPYDPRTGAHAKCDNSATWRASRNEAELWALEGADRSVASILTPDRYRSVAIRGSIFDTCIIPEAGDPRAVGAERSSMPWHLHRSFAQRDGRESFFSVSPTPIWRPSKSSSGAAWARLQEGRPASIRRRSKSTAGGGISPSPKVDRAADDLRLVNLADLRWLVREAGPKFAGRRGNGADESRSAKAFRAGAALKAPGASYEEMRDALLGHEDPELLTGRDQRLASGEREMRRIYDKAGGDSRRCGWETSSRTCNRTTMSSCPRATSGRRPGSTPGCRPSSYSTRAASRLSTPRQAPRSKCARATGSPNMRPSSK